MSAPVRYRFGSFVLSPRERTLVRDGRTVPLIPKYFDLLLLLVERRADAVAKADIFAAVWSDVIVSDGALAQAVRTLRRTLDDDPREPRYIRTVSRHGYQFMAAVAVEPADAPAPAMIGAEPAAVPPSAVASAVAGEVERLLASTTPGAIADESAREAAARLHALDTAAAVAAVRARAGHARALAYLRDARWDDPRAGAVPLSAGDELARTALEVMRLRLAAGAPLVAARARGGLLAGAVLGAVAGSCGGIALVLAPQTRSTGYAPVALAAIGAVAGAVGVGAVATGVAFGEVVARSRRAVAVALSAALAAAAAATAAHLVVRALLEGLFAADGLTIAGPIDGALLGAAIGLAYAAATRTVAGGVLPAPRGWRRAGVLLGTALAGAAGGVLLAMWGRPLVGGLIHAVAQASGDAPLALGPLARLIGEPAFGPATQRLLAAFEGAMFGLASGVALTRRR